MLKVDIAKKLGRLDLDVSFEVNAGVTALFGQSGAGKSSILSAIAGLIQPDAGSIEIGGCSVFDASRNYNVSAEDRDIGMVFQDVKLFPHMDVMKNLTYAQWAGKRGGSMSFSHVVDVLNLDHLLQRYPSNLSGGEKQRIAIGRALLSAPKLLILDEPLSSLDVRRRQRLLPFLKTIRSEFEIPMLFVSHEPDDVIELADDLIIIDQGKVIDSGQVHEVFAGNAMQNLIGAREFGVVIFANVTEYDDQYNMVSACFSGEEGLRYPLHFTGERHEVGRKVRLRISASDVVLALEPPSGTSFQNIVPITITDYHSSSSGQVRVKCDCFGQILFSQITQKSFDELGLSKGQKLFALTKSVALA